jgi:excinuclease ABC subunit A
MHFLPDVWVRCDHCQGKRFTAEILEIQFKGRSIADVLEMTVDQALGLFDNVPNIAKKLQTMEDVGLGYMSLGQSSTTFSGGESQRLKLATELARPSTGNTFYILDEPTTGLHCADIQKLLQVIHRLVASGNTVLVVEHNMDVIKNADHIIDLGPEGGDEGGKVVALGTPKAVASAPTSHTGRVLKHTLAAFSA